MNILEIADEVKTLANKAREGAMAGEFILNEEGVARAFFENQDEERITFMHLLQDAGYENAGYKASYDWQRAKDGILVSYVEGDVYIKAIK